MPGNYALFFIKYSIIQSFCNQFNTHCEINWDKVKSSLRPPGDRRPITTADDLALIKQTFSHKLRGDRDWFTEDNIHWLCDALNREAPALRLRREQFADHASPLELARHLAQVAQDETWNDNTRRPLDGFAGLVMEQLAMPENLRFAVAPPPGNGAIVKAEMRARRLPAARGLQGARLEPDPNVFAVGDTFQLHLTPPGGVSGRYDLYMWQTWDPRQADPALQPWSYRDADNPFLRVLPPRSDTPIPSEAPLLEAPMVNDTGAGWHGLYLVGVKAGSAIAGRCRAAVDDYRNRAQQHGRNPGASYDLVTHQWLLREIKFYLGGRDRNRTELFAGQIMFKLVV